MGFSESLLNGVQPSLAAGLLRGLTNAFYRSYGQAVDGTYWRQTSIHGVVASIN